MWQKLSLRGRINLLLALVLALGLAINVARLVLEAAPRVQAEDESVTRLAREFIEPIVSGLNDPSSGVIVGNRVYFIESKYGLLFQHKEHPEEIPTNVPFDLQSRELPK